MPQPDSLPLYDISHNALLFTLEQLQFQLQLVSAVKSRYKLPTYSIGRIKLSSQLEGRQAKEEGRGLIHALINLAAILFAA